MNCQIEYVDFMNYSYISKSLQQQTFHGWIIQH